MITHTIEAVRHNHGSQHHIIRKTDVNGNVEIIMFTADIPKLSIEDNNQGTSLKERAR